MITLTARIDLSSGNNGSLSDGLVSPLGNNISSDIVAILGSKSQGSNPFLLGISKLGDGSTFSEELNYFIGSQKSDGNGIFQEPYEITFSSAVGIKSITISFDTVNNRFPKNIKVDGVLYSDDDPIFTVANKMQVALSETVETHSIVIENWNTPNYPLVIQGIYIDISIDIDYRNLISLNRSITYRSDNKLPSYGIISNTGNLEFNDLDGEIKDYAEQLLLTSDLKVVITLNNTLADTHEQVGIFETKDWDYDNDNRSVSVSLKDDLEEWQDIQVQGINYDPREPFKIIADGKMSNVYKWLQGQDENGNYRTPEKYQMLAFEDLDDKTKNILENTEIKYPLLENGTLWEQWEKLCQVCGLYIYKNNEGKTVCTYTYGS
jgi:hypothetical protein